MTQGRPLIIQVSSSPDSNADALSALAPYANEWERWLYVMGKFAAGPGIRTRNIEGLGEDWLALRNAALLGDDPGQRFLHDPGGYFANGCVAIALRDIVTERDGSIHSLMVNRAGAPSVRLNAAQLEGSRLARLVRAYTCGDVWQLSGPEWALVLDALQPRLSHAL